MITFEVAKRHEKNGEWSEALKAWKELLILVSYEVKDHVQSQIDALEILLSAIKKGDEYRKRIEPVNEL